MRKLLLLFFCMLLISPLFGIKVGGVELPSSYHSGEDELILNGYGLRKKLIINVYACGLYLPSKSGDSSEILNTDEPIVLRMHFIYKEVDHASLIGAWNEGFAKTGALQEFAIERAQFNSFFSEPAKKGDIYDLVYLPESGLSVLRNNLELGKIENPAFRKAVFSIWLSENTELPKLREQLLGD
jgi:hypothetical protein